MQVRTETVINASPERVWDVLTDFRAYSQWNPFITGISGKLAQGEQLQVIVHQPGGRELSFHPKVLKVAAARELRWKAQLMFGGLFDGEHYFELHAAEGDEGLQQTRLVHGEQFSGLLVKMLTRRLTQTARGFASMNQAIKARAEAA